MYLWLFSIPGIQRAILFLKWDVELFNHVHVERLNRIKDTIKRNEANKHDSEQLSQPPTLSQTLSDPKVLKHIDDIVNNFYNMKKMAMSMPSFVLIPEKQSMYSIF